MVNISIEDGFVNFDVRGIDRLWSLRTGLVIPLGHIRSVSVDTEAARGWWHGLKIMGTQVPGVVTAGTFYEHGGIVFYDVHDPERTIVLELDHERYSRLVLEVEDPDAAVSCIRDATRGQSS